MPATVLSIGRISGLFTCGIPAQASDAGSTAILHRQRPDMDMLNGEKISTHRALEV